MPKNKHVPKPKPALCPDCGCKLPGPYGAVGVSLARRDNKTLICSACGVREAFANYLDRLRRA